MDVMDPWLLGALLSLWGLFNGVITAKVGLKGKYELPLWILGCSIWFLVIGDDMTSSLILMMSTMAGILNGGAQVLLLDEYKENNPWYAEQFEKMGDKAAQQMMTFSFAMGIISGFALAGIVWFMF